MQQRLQDLHRIGIMQATLVAFFVALDWQTSGPAPAGLQRRLAQTAQASVLHVPRILLQESDRPDIHHDRPHRSR